MSTLPPSINPARDAVRPPPAARRDASREEVAQKEVGHTDVSRPVACVMLAAFIALVAGVPLWQAAHDRAGQGGGRALAPTARHAQVDVAGSPGRTGGRSIWRWLSAGNDAVLRSLSDLEDRLEDRSVLSAAVLPVTQAVLARLGAGNEQAYVGRAGWLFYRPDVEYVANPGFLQPPARSFGAGPRPEHPAPPRGDPIAVIRDFHRELGARGIQLVVMPVPSKAGIHPARFSRRVPPGPGGLQNPSWERFLGLLSGSGVMVVDPSAALRGGADETAYLATDTHWRPAAMERVAARLAEVVRETVELPAAGGRHFRTREVTVRNPGDIAAMLRLPPGQGLFPPEQVVIRQILGPDAEPWRPEQEADVLLLGDSFSNIYAAAGMGWGGAAGLAEHLALHLGRPVDAIIRNDGGAHATRELLAAELRRGHPRLEGKRVVVWQFAARELLFGAWKPVPLPEGSDPTTGGFFVPPGGETWIVTARVEEVSPVPRPGSVPYQDHIATVRLGAVQRVGGAGIPGGAIVHLWSMRDNVWTPAARLRPGDEVRLRLRPWSDVAPEFERINRSELPDTSLQLEEPCWGELEEGS